jgi:hypothetical protein
MGRPAKICRKADNPQADWMVFHDRVADLVGRFQQGQELSRCQETPYRGDFAIQEPMAEADAVTGRAPTRGALPREYFP